MVGGEPNVGFYACAACCESCVERDMAPVVVVGVAVFGYDVATKVSCIVVFERAIGIWLFPIIDYCLKSVVFSRRRQSTYQYPNERYVDANERSEVCQGNKFLSYMAAITPNILKTTTTITIHLQHRCFLLRGGLTLSLPRVLVALHILITRFEPCCDGCVELFSDCASRKLVILDNWL